MAKKLVIISTHPIQYYAPVFRSLAASPELDVHVIYTMGNWSDGHTDKGFGRSVQWDIPLLDGYPYSFLKNTARDPGSHHYTGIDNPDILEQVMTLNPDVLMVYGWAYKSHLKILQHFKGKVPVMFRGDSTLLDERPGIRTMLRRIFLKWVYKHVDVALYVGSENKRYFLKHGLKEEQLAFAPHSIDNSRFENPAPGLSRRGLGIAEHEQVILFTGKLIPKKNPGILLNAFLKMNLPGIHLFFVGNGALEKELKKQAQGTSNIHFIDFQNQSVMPSVYQLADIVCLPSSGPGETWGLTVNEAMAAGKAVLVSDRVGCAADLVKPGVNGEVFKAGNAPDLKKKLEYLLSDPARLISMGEESKKIISGWTPAIQKEHIIDTIRNIRRQGF